MSNKLNLTKIASQIEARARKALQGAPPSSSVSPTLSRRQKDRLRVVLSEYYVALDELNNVFQDISTTSALSYFSSNEAGLIRQAASSLSDARRVIRRLARYEWVRKSK